MNQPVTETTTKLKENIQTPKLNRKKKINNKIKRVSG